VVRLEQALQSPKEQKNQTDGKSLARQTGKLVDARASHCSPRNEDFGD
jgi:hypothetical protein